MYLLVFYGYTEDVVYRYSNLDELLNDWGFSSVVLFKDAYPNALIYEIKRKVA